MTYSGAVEALPAMHVKIVVSGVRQLQLGFGDTNISNLLKYHQVMFASSRVIVISYLTNTTPWLI